MQISPAFLGGLINQKNGLFRSSLKPLLLTVYKGNIDFEIANDILYNILNSWYI